MKKNEIMPITATWIDLLSEVSPTEKDKCHITYMQNLKYDTNEFIYKTETDSQIQKTNLWLPKGKGQGRAKLGV